MHKSVETVAGIRDLGFGTWGFGPTFGDVHLWSRVVELGILDSGQNPHP